MNNYFIILAAGNSSRFKSKIPKQYSMYKGIQTFQHSINKALKSKMFKKRLELTWSVIADTWIKNFLK